MGQTSLDVVRCLSLDLADLSAGFCLGFRKNIAKRTSATRHGLLMWTWLRGLREFLDFPFCLELKSKRLSDSLTK